MAMDRWESGKAPNLQRVKLKDFKIAILEQPELFPVGTGFHFNCLAKTVSPPHPLSLRRSLSSKPTEKHSWQTELSVA